jgi:hypothetical protein
LTDNEKLIRPWQEIAKEASQEQGPKRLCELIEELHKALELEEEKK